MIRNWCCDPTGCNEDCPLSLDDAEDCMDAATLEYEPFSPDWIDFVEKCAEALEEMN